MPDSIEIEINPDDLPDLPKEQQISAMRSWFYSRWEDPINLPYVTEAGGYLWIHGEPVEPRDILENEFHAFVSEEALEEVCGELENISDEWSPIPEQDYFDDYYAESVHNEHDHFEDFTQAIAKIKILVDVEVPTELHGHYQSLLFVNVITTMETYLCDRFIHEVLSDGSIRDRFFSTTKYFQQKKVTLSEAYSGLGKLDEIAQEFLLDLAWHNLPRVMPLYEATLDVKELDWKLLMPSVFKRHDIVHRNGKDKNGNAIVITQDDVEQLIANVESFVGKLDEKIIQVPF